MSNDLKFSQEEKNLILDLKDVVNAHSRTINEMAKRINVQNTKIHELEGKILMNNTSVGFNDIFKEKK